MEKLYMCEGKLCNSKLTLTAQIWFEIPDSCLIMKTWDLKHKTIWIDMNLVN